MQNQLYNGLAAKSLAADPFRNAQYEEDPFSNAQYEEVTPALCVLNYLNVILFFSLFFCNLLL